MLVWAMETIDVYVVFTQSELQSNKSLGSKIVVVSTNANRVQLSNKLLRSVFLQIPIRVGEFV
jgi:hypothetical protein